MKSSRKAGIGAAAALIGLLYAAVPSKAEAQPRQHTPPQAQMAIPKAVQRVPPQLVIGVQARGRHFAGSFYYQRGIPFFNGFPGYLAGNFWFPFGYGPQSFILPPPWVVAEQWYNVSRPFPPMGAYYGGAVSYSRPRYNMWGQRIAEPTESVNERLLEGYIKNRDELEQLRIKEAEQKGEQRGYERAQQEFEAEQQPPTRDDKIELRLRYGGKINKPQYDDVGVEYFIGLFESMRRLSDGNVNLIPYDAGNNRLEIRDGNTHDYRGVGIINMSRYRNCVDVNGLLDVLTNDFSRAVDLSDYPNLVSRARSNLNISTSGYSADCQ